MQGDKKAASATVNDYKINSGLTPEVLGQKPATTPLGVPPPKP
jgi:hypothetical protein